MRGVFLLVGVVACAAPAPTPDASQEGVRQPRLGHLCECDDATATLPCEAATCGPGAACLGQRCGIACATSQECPAGAWCDPNSGSCWWVCSTDADCVDRDVTSCAPVGACFEPA